jgi:hypothetical protein
VNFPFTRQAFFDVFAAYNEGVWPFQVAAVAAALLIVGSRWGPPRTRTMAIGVLGALWIWMGVVYHWVYFSPINPVARVFALLFVTQGILLIWAGPVRRRMSLASQPGGAQAAVGALLVVYALAGYPLVAMLAGQTYPAMPTFGLPCPTVIFTFAVLSASTGTPKTLFIIPLLWAAIGTSVAVSLGVVEDYALLPAALIAMWVAYLGSRTRFATNAAVPARAIEKALPGVSRRP